MQLDLDGKSVLVTGGTRGIGRAIVEAIAAAGARVAFTYRASAETAEGLRARLVEAGGEAMAIQGDAADFQSAQETVQQVLDAYGSVDVVVNNAGVTRDNLLIRMSEEDWDQVIGTNLKSVFNFSKAVYRPMMKQRSGSIINVSSVVGVMGNAGQANYAASKAGIIGFTKSLARELGGRKPLSRRCSAACRWGVPRSRRTSPMPYSFWPPTPPPISPATSCTSTVGSRCSTPGLARPRRRAFHTRVAGCELPARKELPRRAVLSADNSLLK
jgi:3-oxoacyl-[acyl-carrier protein] reductase